MTVAEPLKAPWPYFGGKSRAAELIWSRFGNPANYVELPPALHPAGNGRCRDVESCGEHSKASFSRSVRLDSSGNIFLPEFGRPSGALSHALCGPALFPSHRYPLGNRFIRVGGSVNCQVVSEGNKFKVFKRVIQLVLVSVVNRHAFGNRPVCLFPNKPSLQYPHARLCNFDERTLLPAALVASAYANGSNGQLVMAHERIIPNYA